jgi:carboxyl-terminal processing protease
MLKRSAFLSLLAAAITIVTVGAMPPPTRGEAAERRPEEMRQRVGWLLDQVRENYVDEVGTRRLLVGAYQGVLAKADPDATWLPPEMVKDARPEAGEWLPELGLSIRFLPLNKAILVETCVPGGAAFDEGMLTRDFIVEIRNDDTGETLKTKDMFTELDAVQALQGEPGTKVGLTVLRIYTGQKLELTLTRREPARPALVTDVLEADGRRFGYVYVPDFDEGTPTELRAAIEKLAADGAEGVVVDLRFNPGGDVSQAVECADLFVEAGTLMRLKKRNGIEQVRPARPGSPFAATPVVLLTNSYSSGAAEVFVAALQGEGRAPVVGRVTLGKASAYRVIANPHDMSAIRIVAARYCKADGKELEGDGVEPDVEVGLNAIGVQLLAASMTDLMRGVRTPLDPLSVRPPVAAEKPDLSHLEPEEDGAVAEPPQMPRSEIDEEAPNAPDAEGEAAGGQPEEGEGAEAEPQGPPTDVQLQRAVSVLTAVVDGKPYLEEKTEEEPAEADAA